MVCGSAGGPALNDLTSLPLAGAPSASSKAEASAKASESTTSSVWRSFTDSEEKRLEAAWQKLDVETREKAWRSKVATKANDKDSKKADTAGSNSGPSTADASESAVKTGSKAKTEAIKKSETASASKASADQAQESYIADPEKESQPHVVHVSQDNLFSADLRCKHSSPPASGWSHEGLFH